MLNCKVIHYSSRNLKLREKNYPTYDLDATVVFSLMIWSNYLYDVHVNIFADHKGLQDVFTRN